MLLLNYIIAVQHLAKIDFICLSASSVHMLLCAVALKSFGLCATMCKLAIPIPVDKTEVIGGSNSEGPRVDYFDHVLIDIGDSQSVLTGYSTLMAKLNTCSRIIKRIEDYDCENNGKSEVCFQQLPLLLSTPHHLVYFLCNMPIIIKEESSSSSKSCLVLFDELGSGTDPESGSAIARAILEYLIEPKKSSICRVIATTHSPQLKLLPSIDHRFRSASVLLQDSSTAIKYTSAAADMYKLPSYKLAYDISGDSYMLGAASRCQPPLPREIIEQAADYCLNSTSTISNSNTSMSWNGSQILSVQEAILQDRDAAARARHEAEEELREIQRLRDATIHLTQNFEAQIRRIEYRLSELMKQMKEENNEKYTYDIIGNSLESIRLSKKAVANAADVLAKKGLRLVPPTYKLSVNEIVVVIAQGEWEGETAVVKQFCEETGDIILKPTFGWGGGLLFPDSVVPSSMSDLRTIALKRTDIALWDDYSNTLYGMGGGNQEYSRKEEKGKFKSADKLLSVLSTLRPTTTADRPSAKFTSSRERKMIKAEERKLKKGKKKKK
jgi:dsDNA-specific endonuclease/ATPase MutS2